MTSIVLTNCTARKSQGPAVPTLSESAWTSVDHAATIWWQQVRSISRRDAANQVYQGRSVQEAKACVNQLSGALCFVSAGLGLVESNAPIPRYDLSLAQGQGAIAPFLKRLAATPADWWTCLVRRTGRSLRDLAGSTGDRPIYVALPSTYLQLLANELEQLAASTIRERLWVFTTPVGRALLPPSLSERAMPYDQRLDAISGGTQADFPQRCLRHFLSLDVARAESTIAARHAVTRALEVHMLPMRKQGRSVSDADAMALLHTHWHTELGQSSRLLRLFRGELGIACEQARFRALYHRVRAELGEA